MKKGKIIALVLGIVVVAIGAGVFYLIQNLDALVKAGIEKYGSQAAGTSVEVQSVGIALKEGRGTVMGLSVANPSGFSGDIIFTLGEITLDIDTGSVTSEVPVIEEIRIGETGFLFVVNADGKTNVDVLKRNLQRAAGGKGDAGGGEKAPVRLRVKRLTIAEGKGTLDLTAVGGKKLEGTLPGITLTDIGGSQGITPTALGERVLAALVKKLEQSAARQGAERVIREKLGEEAGKLEEKVDEKLGSGTGDALKKMLGQ